MDDANKELWRVGCEVADMGRNTSMVVLHSRTVLAVQVELERLRAVVEAAQEWSGERAVRDFGDAELLKALWTYNGDRTQPCPECDGQCDEPCAPCTVAAAHASIDRQIAALVKSGHLYA